MLLAETFAAVEASRDERAAEQVSGYERSDFITGLPFNLSSMCVM